MTEQLHVTVSYIPAAGFVSAASPQVPRSLTAVSLERLRRSIVATFLLRWRKADQSIAVTFDLDATARAEVERRRAGGTATASQFS